MKPKGTDEAKRTKDMIRTFGKPCALVTLTICVVASFSQLPSLSRTASTNSTHHGARRSPSASLVSLSSVTGSYERDFHGKYSGGLEVQGMPNGRIKFQLVVLGALSSPGGPTLGESDGTILLYLAQHPATAIYQATGGKIAMRFYSQKVSISQDGDLGYGLGANADGIYVKKSRKPNFDSPINQQ